MAHAGFVIEFNNPTAYGKQFKAHLKGKLELRAKRIPHKTAWLVNYAGSFKKFTTLQKRIRRAIKSDGSAMIVSLKTSQVYVLTPSKRKYKLKEVAQFKD
jgi:hypothetical protein